MRSRFAHPVCLGLIALGLMAAAGVLACRHRVEARARRVALIADLDQARSVAAAAGMGLEPALQLLGAAGITGLALPEETLGDLLDGGLIAVAAAPAQGGHEYRVRAVDPGTEARLRVAAARAGAGAGVPMEGDRCRIGGHGSGDLFLAGRFEEYRLLPAGLDPDAVAACRRAGLEPVARLLNPLGLTGTALEESLDAVRDAGASLVIFSGEEVLGYRGLLRQTAEALRARGLLYGSIEFGKQRGDETLAAEMGTGVIRVHSISPAEMARLQPTDAIDRYVLAASERNIRALYVRLPGVVSSRPAEDSSDYVRDLVGELRRARLDTGRPSVFSAPLPPELTALARLAMGLATGAGAALLLAAVAPLRGTRQAVTGAVLGLVLGLAAASDHTRLLQITALAAAVVFPALALLGLVDVSGGETAVGGRGPGIASALVLLARVSLLTLAGAALTAGMLSDPGFMLKTRVFAGIKAATALPILLAAAAAITGATAGCETWSDQRQATAARLRSFLAEPVRVWQAAAVLAAGAALALLILRTGNDAGVGVSDLELRFRGLLDRILGVRPRTKEFLVGHPAMLLGLFLLARAEWRRWSVPFLLVGMIGQVGMLNSFCHLHTPILVTILRTINGLWVGALLGLAVVWPVRLSSRAAGCE